MKKQTLFKKIGTTRSDFPIFNQTEHTNKLCYLDNAATTHKPQSVIDAMVQFYSHDNATVGRAIYTIGERATRLYEAARETVQLFIGAHNSSEIVFTRGATEGINVIAHAWAMQHLHAGDEIVLTELEHHANLLPWQRVSKQTGALIKCIPIYPDGALDYTQLDTIITHKTKLVAITHSSNALGTSIDTAPIINRARQVGARILIDASQSAPHQRITVTSLDPDFLVFSGHKMLGPTGIGVLYIKKSVHPELIPYQSGGGMVMQATWHEAHWLTMPHLLEAGTPAIAQAIGLASAITYLEEIDFKELAIHEAALCSRLIDGLLKLPRIRILGPIDQLRTHGHLVSFVVDGLHAHDVAAYLDQKGICVRAGHHCAQPLAQKLGIEASVRVSFYLYNTKEEVDFFLAELMQIISELPKIQ